MKLTPVVVLAMTIVAVSACEKKPKPLAPILPAASTQEEFLAGFEQTCIAGAKSVKIAKVDEEELTVDQLKTGCTCAQEMLSRNTADAQWKEILEASSKHAEPPRETAVYLHETLSKCFAYAVGPEQ